MMAGPFTWLQRLWWRLRRAWARRKELYVRLDKMNRQWWDRNNH